MKDPDWLLRTDPREVQMEALRRSYGGFSFKDRIDDSGRLTRLRGGPATGWSHYMQMRLGKTSTALAEFELFSRDYGTKNMVVVCPQTFKLGWVKEARDTGASVPWLVWDSNQPSRVLAEISKARGRYGLAVNYEALKTGEFAKAMHSIITPQTYLAFDESIKIKSPTSLQTKAALSMSKIATIRRNLSGLPMTQGPQDLYTQFRCIGRFEGVNFFAFRNRYCKMGGFKNKQIVGARNEQELSNILSKYSFVAKTADWAAAASKSYYEESMVLEDEQLTYYREMERDMVLMLKSGETISVDMVVTKLMKLQQISSGFVYDEQNRAVPLLEAGHVPKVRKLLDILEETDQKVIVVFNYQYSGDLLYNQLAGFNPAVIRGQDWMRKQGRNVDQEKARFNSDPDCKVMLLQISSGKYGHNLVGNDTNRCGTMIFYENTYSLDDRIQVEARNTGPGQDWSNNYHDFVSSKVERSVLKALVKKESLVEAVMRVYSDPQGAVPHET